MILTRQDLTSKGKHEFFEEIKISPDQIKNNPLIISIKKLEGRVESEYIASLTIVKIKLTGDLLLKSTRSLKPVDFHLCSNDELVIAYSKDEDFDPDSMVYLEGDSLNMDEIFYSMLISSIPLKVISEEDEEIIKGDDWEVITEEEYEKRKKNGDNLSQFDVLKDLDLD